MVAVVLHSAAFESEMSKDKRCRSLYGFDDNSNRVWILESSPFGGRTVIAFSRQTDRQTDRRTDGQTDRQTQIKH